MSFSAKIKAHPLLKKVAHWMLIAPNDFRPRLWVRVFYNPFIHKKGRGTIIRRRTRMDVFPFNHFEIGEGSMIEEFSTINNGVGDVVIGNETIIGLGCTIIGPVAIGDKVMLAQSVVISGLNHGYERVDIYPSQQKTVTEKITIKDGAWIGANSVVTPGVIIGKHAIIGAGSVVTKSVPDYSVSVGNPARIIKRYNFEKGVWEKV